MLISYTTHVDAPPDLVWRESIDVESWPNHAPQMRSIVRLDDGPFRLGSSARVTPHGFWGAVWTVTEFVDGRSFSWGCDMLPGIHLVAGHVVEPDRDGAKLTLSLQSSGPGATLLAPVLGRIFRRNVGQEGAGLKAYCERAV